MALERMLCIRVTKNITETKASSRHVYDQQLRHLHRCHWYTQQQWQLQKY